MPFPRPSRTQRTCSPSAPAPRLIPFALALATGTGLAGCRTRMPKGPVPSGFVTRVTKEESGSRRVAKLIDRAAKEPLRGHELEEAFLVAESLLQEKQFEAATKLYRGIFGTSPTLVVGLKLARLLTLSGETSQAENAVKKLQLLYPKSAEPSLALAFLEQIRGSRDEALSTLEEAHRKHPKNEEVAARYTEVLLEAGRKDKAKAILLESIKAMPDSTYFLLRLARLRTEDGNFKEAKNLLDRLLRIDPENTDAWMLAGYIAAEEKNSEAAERYFREAYEKQPENDVLARYYVGQLLRQDKYQEARRLLMRLDQSADEATPLDPELTFQLGFVLFQLEEYAEARKRFASLVGKAPDRGRMLFFVGQCDELLKAFAGARKSYESIPAESDFHSQGRQRLIILALEDGKFDEARSRIADYKKDVREEEQDYRFLAGIHARLKDYAQAGALVREGLAKFPKSAELAYLKAAYLEHTESKEASLVALEGFLKTFPEHAQALNHLGYALAEAGRRLDAAEAFLKRAIKAEPKNGFFLDSLGWVYVKQGKYEVAEKYLLQALQREPDEPVILEHLGELKMLKNEFGLALRYFERAKTMFDEKPAWKIDNDTEWKTSAARVKARIAELRRMALGSESPQASPTK